MNFCHLIAFQLISKNTQQLYYGVLSVKVVVSSTGGFLFTQWELTWGSRNIFKAPSTATLLAVDLNRFINFVLWKTASLIRHVLRLTAVLLQPMFTPNRYHGTVQHFIIRIPCCVNRK